MNTPSRPGAPVGFAIVGTGMIAGFHARAIARTHGARLVGVVSRSPEKGRAFAEEHGALAVAASVEEICQRPDVLAVAVTTPSGAHLEPALAAIAAGRHVVVEKPLETTPARANRIILAAQAAGVKIAGIFQGRFGSGARRVKAALDAGRFGRLGIVNASVKWYRSAEYYTTPWKGRWDLDGGGALMNQAIHAVDLLQWFAGMPVEVHGFIARRVHAGIEADDTTVASLRFADGTLGTIEASTAVWPGWSRRIELCGERGSVCLEEDEITRWEFSDALPEDGAVRASSNRQSLGSGASAAAGISLTGHLRQIEDFVAAIAENRPPAIDGRACRNAVALVHAIYQSAQCGAPVKP